MKRPARPEPIERFTERLPHMDFPAKDDAERLTEAQPENDQVVVQLLRYYKILCLTKSHRPEACDMDQLIDVLKTMEATLFKRTGRKYSLVTKLLCRRGKRRLKSKDMAEVVTEVVNATSSPETAKRVLQAHNIPAPMPLQSSSRVRTPGDNQRRRPGGGRQGSASPVVLSPLQKRLLGPLSPGAERNVGAVLASAQKAKARVASRAPHLDTGVGRSSSDSEANTARRRARDQEVLKLSLSPECKRMRKVMDVVSQASLFERWRNSRRRLPDIANKAAEANENSGTVSATAFELPTLPTPREIREQRPNSRGRDLLFTGGLGDRFSFDGLHELAIDEFIKRLPISLKLAGNEPEDAEEPFEWPVDEVQRWNRWHGNKPKKG